MAVSPEHLEQARELREAIYRLAHPMTRDKPDPADVAMVNAWASRPDFAPELSGDARAVRLRCDNPVEAGLSAVARDAVDLISGRWLSSVRECSHPECSLLFVDLSRPGQRRWCDMNSCGNRVKARRYRTAHSARASGASVAADSSVAMDSSLTMESPVTMEPPVAADPSGVLDFSDEQSEAEDATLAG